MTPPYVQRPPHAEANKAAPVMPRIPGVNDENAGGHVQWKPLSAVIVVALVCAGGFAYWLSHRRPADQEASAAPTAAAPEFSIPDPSANAESDGDPNSIARVDELARAWSSKKFNFVDPQSHDRVAAMVIRLPGSGDSFWAFSLNPPFSRCELQFVSDLTALSQRFAFPATHPMVVSDCDGTIYDPLKIATLPDGAWVRGDIVRGSGIRPPLAIQVQVRGRELIASRIE